MVNFLPVRLNTFIRLIEANENHLPKTLIQLSLYFPDSCIGTDGN